jgi:drug/metabolite transporter (DMT)-like permease
MVIIASLIAAVLYGSGDFCGGMAARKATAVQVVACSHAVGLIGVTILALAIAERFDPSDLALGAAGGALGALGVGLLYRRLAVGPMYVVAPITAITAAVVPTIWGAATGELLSGLAWLGISIALVAVGLVSYSPASSGGATVTVQVVAESLASGCGFGGFFIFLGATGADTAPWPIVGARLTTTVVLGVFLVMTGRPVVPSGGGTRWLIAATGVLEIGANVGFLFASGRGELAIAAVLISLYPIATVVLARVLLDERMTLVQQCGVGVALAATGLIATS